MISDNHHVMMADATAAQSLNILVCGASGFIGTRLVPLLIARGHRCTLVGRDAELLATRFPSVPSIDYAAYFAASSTFDVVLNLATINTDADVADEAVHQVNCDFALALYRKATQSGSARFVQLSSSHALDPWNRSAYAVSKRDMGTALMREPGTEVDIVYCGYFLGERLNAGFFCRLPGQHIRSLLAQVVGSLKPTTSMHDLVQAIVRPATGDRKASIHVFDSKLENRAYTIMRRAFDVVFSVVGVILLAATFVPIALAIVVTSGSPIVFRQQRVGRAGRLFTLYKYRTMKQATPDLPSHDVSRGSVTSVGAFLRKWKIDEIVQFLNILKGDMTLVGWRPSLPSQHELNVLRAENGIDRDKPGVTGLAPVLGVDMSDPVRLVAVEKQYLMLQSVVFDLKLVFRTFFGGGAGDAVK